VSQTKAGDLNMSGLESNEVLKLSREIQLSFGKIIRLVSLHFLLHNNVQIHTLNTVAGSKVSQL
jgi:hypothetical protein